MLVFYITLLLLAGLSMGYMAISTYRLGDHYAKKTIEKKRKERLINFDCSIRTIVDTREFLEKECAEPVLAWCYGRMYCSMCPHYKPTGRQ